MLGILIFLAWIVVFCIPLIVNIVKAIREKEVSVGWWVFSITWAVVGGILIRILMWMLHVWTEVLWFADSGDYVSRFWTVFWAQREYFLLGFVISFIFFWLNIRGTKVGLDQDLKKKFPRWVYPMCIGISVFVAFIFGLFTAGEVFRFLLYKNQPAFGITEPIFSKDIGFYVFTIPVLQFLRDISIFAIIIAIIGTLSIYAGQHWFVRDNSYRWEKSDEEKKLKANVRYRAITHLSILGILLMISFIFATRLAIWDILFSTRGAVFGAGWTDVHNQVSAYWQFIFAMAIAIICLIVSAIAHTPKMTERMAAVGFGLCFLVWLIRVITIPAIVQVYVHRNELSRETEYIKYNIAFTRKAYGLDKVKQSAFPVNMEIDPGILKRDQATLSSIRLWDWRVLQATNNQNQAFRLYFSFPDVDVTRYNINGQIVQMMFSSRELDQNRLAPKSKTWQNTRLTFTHGIGGCGNAVNIFTPEGLPEYWIKDIPPVSKYPQLHIGEPRIYFGELTTQYVYVKTKHPEFDYPLGDTNVTYFYKGPGGVRVGSGLRKLAFALRFDGIGLLFANEITDESRIMFRRDIESRVKTLAPFLGYDGDMYQVVALDSLWYIWDAYTTTDHYPYSEPNGDLNYIRNSVKVVVNDFTGKVDFYIFDDKDPIILAYQKIFPGLFKPASAMPAALRQHIRYPEDLLRIQGEIYSVYHMDDPTVFYNREDAWEIAKESSHDTVQTVLPYYVTMTIPGEKTEEFVQMLPFTPLTTNKNNPRNNMVAWLAGRCDGEHYSELINYRFPKDYLVYGPLQVGIRMNQDETISKDFTLWNQQGSKVILGNFLVIPLSNFGILYAQPIYLQAQIGKMPELKRVVVALGDKLAYGVSFDDALGQLLGMVVEIKGTREVTTTKIDLIKEAAKHLELYRQLTGQGKFSEAGKEMEQLSRIIGDLLKQK